MKLYLIRHGETVDNVAGLYAGTRDSKLTNHGVEQTNRLGSHFARNGVRFTHIYASPLSRALRTAQAIQQAQDKLIAAGGGGNAAKVAEIVQVAELMERDFGFYEGKPFSARARDEEHDQRSSDPGFVDVETKEALANRIDVFLDEHLIPLFEESKADSFAVAVVAHGMLLASFWRRLLLRYAHESLRFTPEVAIKKQGTVLGYIGGWSNTGYMELQHTRKPSPSSITRPSEEAISKNEPDAETASLTAVPPTLPAEEGEVSVPAISSPAAVPSSTAGTQKLDGWSVMVTAVDSTTHLLGLKRQRGGIGSLAHDEGQRKLESFFKKPRVG